MKNGAFIRCSWSSRNKIHVHLFSLALSLFHSCSVFLFLALCMYFRYLFFCNVDCCISMYLCSYLWLFFEWLDFMCLNAFAHAHTHTYGLCVVCRVCGCVCACRHTFQYVQWLRDNIVCYCVHSVSLFCLILLLLLSMFPLNYGRNKRKRISIYGMGTFCWRSYSTFQQ